MIAEAARLGGDALILTFPALIRSDVKELSGEVIVLGVPPTH